MRQWLRLNGGVRRDHFDAAAVLSIRCTRAASASIAKGLVITCMPGSRWPLPTAAFSA